MTKTAWEERVGKLLREPDFVIAYKPVDSQEHGGAVRIDWIACANTGDFWTIEVKYLPDSRKTINLMKEIRPLQREWLDSTSAAFSSVPLLAVGQGNVLYIWGWRIVQKIWNRQQKNRNIEQPELLPLETASVVLHWTGPKNWPPHNYNLLRLFTTLGVPKDRCTPEMQIVLSPRLPEREASLSILKQKGYIPTPVRTRRSER